MRKSGHDAFKIGNRIEFISAFSEDAGVTERLCNRLQSGATEFDSRLLLPFLVLHMFKLNESLAEETGIHVGDGMMIEQRQKILKREIDIKSFYER